MPESPISLPASQREGVRRRIRSVLQFHRDLAPSAVRKASRYVVSRAGVHPEPAGHEQFEAMVDDGEGTERVVLSWDDPNGVRCGCATVKRLGTCHHTLGVLEFLFVELNRREVPEPEPDIPSHLGRLEALGARLTRDREREARAIGRDDPWVGAAHRGTDVRYVLRHAERGDTSSFRLEAQVREQNIDGSRGTWRSVAITVEASSDDDAIGLFGNEHAAVAAIASGAPDADRAVGGGFGRTVGLAQVDRILAPTLLAAAAHAADGTGGLGIRITAAKDIRPLNLAFEEVARLEILCADRSPTAWTIGGRISLPERGLTFSMDDVLAISSDGILVVADANKEATIMLLDAPGARHVIAELRRAPLVVPIADASTLSSIGGVATLVGEDLLNAAHPVEPIACLRIEAPVEAEEGRAAAMQCFVDFDYGGTRVEFDGHDEVVPCLDGRMAPRRRGFEHEALGRFFELGGKRTRAHKRAEHDATVAASRFEGMVMALVEEGWTVVAEDRLIRGMSSVGVSIQSGVDWFDLTGGVTFGDENVPWPTILRAANEQRNYVSLGDGSRGMLPEAWLERWKLAALGDIDAEDEAVRFDQSQAWVLAALVDEADAKVDDPFEMLRGRISSLGRPSAAKPPKTFRGELRPYQEEGLGWLQLLDKTGLSGCLADDMGLGKTVQLLAYLLHRAPTNEGRPSLVVAPRSLVFNWLAETKRFAPDLVAIDFSGAGRWARFHAAPKGALFVTTYGSMRRDAIELKDTEFDVVVLDEAQAIKSQDSQTTKAARVLRARRRVSLTGTPIENHLGDLWSQLDFLNPGMLGAARHFERLGAPRAQAELVEEGQELLARALKPILLRRTKEAVLKDLPAKTEQVLRAPLTGAQRTTYENLAGYFRSELVKSKGEKRKDKLQEVGAPTMNVLAALTRLRQAACHPGLIDKSLVAERSGKLDLVLPMLEEIVAAGKKAIVFSSFTGLLGLMRTRLETLHIPYLLLEGATRDRGALVNKFQTSEGGQVFLISIKAGGSGLNLTAGDYVFLMDPWWNPAVEAQAIDRAHRMGRKQTVHVYRVLTEETVEARVVELQANKRALSESVLSGATTSVSDLAPADLQFLLS